MHESESFSRVAGLAVYHHRGDDGPRVVLVHGSMDRAAGFIKVARRAAGRSITRYDRRGYGRSADVDPSAGLAGPVDDLDAVIGAGPAVVVGHSLGGVIALTLAAERPERVLAVGAFEAPMPWAPWWPRHSAGGDAVAAAADLGPDAAAERFLRRMIGDARWEALPASTRATRRAEGRALLADLLAVRDGAPYHPRSLRVPVVAGRGTEAEAHHRRAADELAASVPGAELVVIDGAGHGAHGSHPEAFAAFVARVVEAGLPHGPGSGEGPGDGAGAGGAGVGRR